MVTVIRQHIINMLEPLDMLCSDADKWLEEECLPSDHFSTIYQRLLQQSETKWELRNWLLGFYELIGLEEAEDLLWHYHKVNPPETPEGWRENVFESLPDAREVEEALRICYQDWHEQYLINCEQYNVEAQWGVESDE